MLDLTLSDILIIILVLTLVLGLPIRAFYVVVRRASVGVQIHPLQEPGYPIIEDLLKLITRECEKIYSTNFTYRAAKHAGGIDHSPLLNPVNVITDAMVDEATLQVTSKIMDDMSLTYQERLYLVINPLTLEDYIMEEVYIQIFTRAIEINQSTVRR